MLHKGHDITSCSLLQVWEYTSCQAHVRVCMEIASAKTLGLAQAYDEMVRREWSEKAKRGMGWSTPGGKRLLIGRLTGDLEFDVNKASMRKDADIFDRAVDQIAAMQTGRGKGASCHCLPAAISHSCLPFVSFKVPTRAKDSSSNSASIAHSSCSSNMEMEAARRSSVRSRCTQALAVTFCAYLRIPQAICKAWFQSCQGQGQGRRSSAVGPIHGFACSQEAEARWRS